MNKEEVFALGNDAVGFIKTGMDNVIKELIQFKKLMDEANEVFFLTSGVCLGIVRDGALIKHDKDIDIGVLGEENLYRIEKKLSSYYDQAHITGVKNGKILWLKKIVNESILIMEVQAHYAKDNYVYYNRDLGESWKKKDWNREGRVVWDKKFFNKFMKIGFMGETFNVPSLIEEYLTAFYGDWKTPIKYIDWRYHCDNLYKGYWL